MVSVGGVKKGCGHLEDYKFNLFIGYDSNRPLVHEVCKYSIEKRISSQIMIKKIGSSVLNKNIWWKTEKNNSTEFSNNRFLIPFLNDFKGFSIYMDDDFLCNCDICELVNFFDFNCAVCVVKHKNYKSKVLKKMDNIVQKNYFKKNWSSLMIFNNSHEDVLKLSPKFVNEVNPLLLHQFNWTKKVGGIPLTYNYLVDEYETIEHEKIKMLHYTIGGPWYQEFTNCSYSNVWNKEKEEYLSYVN